MNYCCKLLLIVGISLLFTVDSYSQKKYSVHLSGHYANQFKTSSERENEGEKGRMGNAIEFRYYLGDQSKKVNTAIGVSYTRFGLGRTFQWTDATPEREEQYGSFPITYEMWDDAHYISFPLYLNLNPGVGWTVSISGSLDYPIGVNYFRERSSADLQVVETTRDGFQSTKAYPWNTSIGSGFLIGKTIRLNENLDLFVESQFKVYTLLAFRSNDYFPHEENVRPYTLGINIGIKM